MAHDVSVTLLKQLKREYQKNNVSALVGAGLSKNAIPTFPSWSELLLPIVEEMYRSEFGKLLADMATDPNYAKMDIGRRKRIVCEELLYKYGNLEVVSEYIRRRGIGHESIDAYIEEHIHPAKKAPRNKWKCGSVTYTKRELETHIELLKCDKFRNIYTTNYDNLLEFTQEFSSMPDKLRVVTSETTLSDTSSNRAIVKLHGDISQSTVEKYEFDGDKNLKYIIAKEDYDTYMAKHQGFSYLMRLAMLQGRFCLIGFSGTDPNYMLWLQWMKDVMDKAIETETRIHSRGKGAKEVPEKRVYLISAFEYIPEEATELFYKNHHVGVIDLTKAEVQNELFGSVKSSSGGVTYSTDATTLLQQFFRYLQEGADDSKKGRYVYVEKRNAESYWELWRTATDALSKHLDLKPILQKIENSYDTSINPLSVGWQESIITSFMNHYSLLDNADYRRLFALAVRDTGTMPSYYREVLPTRDCMNDDVIWKQLELREHILNIEAEDYYVYSKGSHLDMVMYYAFRLEFQKMYDTIRKWKPTEDEKPLYWLLLSLFENRDDTIQDWDNYIDRLKEGAKKVNACSMRNLQSRDYPPKYDLSQEKQKGVITITQKIVDASTNICKVEKNTSAYGMVSRSFTWNQGNPTYERSLRLLNLLYDNAYLPLYYAKTIIKDEDWYDAFTQLYEQYPFPTIYYSLYITKASLRKKMGQDMVYSKALSKRVEMILQQMLMALGEKNMPVGVYRGLLALSQEMYIAVRPNGWSDLFMSYVFEPLLKGWDASLSSMDDALHNAEEALKYITDPQKVNYIFLRLIEHIQETPDIINMIYSNCLQMRRIQQDDAKVQKVIEDKVKNGSLQHYVNVYYILAFYEKLSEKQREAIGNKILTEDLDFVKKNPRAIILLAYLTKTAEQVQRVKELVMQHGNIWDCGKNNRVLSEPSFLNIAAFPVEWDWDIKELETIIKNMEENISAIVEVKEIPTEWLTGSYMQWLDKMLLFVKRQGYWETAKGSKVTKLLKTLMHKLDADESIDILLLSDNYFMLNHGISSLLYELSTEPKDKEIARYDSEISVLLTRAMMLDGTQFQTIISMIEHLTRTYPAQMIGRYRDKLLYILRNSEDLDYKKLNINLAAVQNSLCHIAKIMEEHGEKGEEIQTWLNDAMLTRFNGAIDEAEA